MENASKALLIAGGMLISILVFSLFAYLFASMSGYAKNTYGIVEDNRINQFNNQFVKYDGRNDLTVHDVLTIINLAESNNKTYQLDEESGDSSFFITVERYGIFPNSKTEEEYILEAVKGDVNGPYSYNCKVEYNLKTKRINKIKINRNT